MDNIERPKCKSVNCNNRVEIVTTSGDESCRRCWEEINGTPTTLWEAIKPRESLRKKLKNLLDNGKMRG